MPIFLVTVLYNSENHLLAFLECLKSQTFQDWHLVAIDNASKDKSGDVVSEFADARVTVIRNVENVGFAKASNQGLRLAAQKGATFFILINSDTVFEASFLEKFVMVRDKLSAQVLAPRIMRLESPEKSWYAGGHLAYDWVFRNVHESYDPADTREYRKVEFASGCCFGVSRHILECVGLLDESFFVYWEDTDFCIRLKAARIPIFYVREPSILHYGGASSGHESSESYNKLFYKSYAQILRKHFGPLGAVRAVLRMLARELVRPERKRIEVAVMGGALLKGVFSPLVRQSRL